MALSTFRTNYQMFNTTPQGASVSPSLLLDFTKIEKLDPRITFSRPSSATRFNSRGLMETVSSEVPRYEFDPATKRQIGLMIEDGRTNLLPHSNNFSSAEWISVTSTIVTSQDQVGLDGAGSAWTFNDQSTASADDGVFRNITITPSSSTSYCVSIWAKQGTAAYFDFYVFFQGTSVKGTSLRHTWATGATTVASQDGGGALPLDYGKIAYPNGWHRFYFVVRDSNSGLNNTLQMRICPAGRGSVVSGTTLFQRAQIEIGEYPTSYIPTTTAAVPRSTESATVNGGYFTPWFNASNGTLYADVINNTRTVAASYPRLVSLVGSNPNTDEMSIYTRSQISGDVGAGQSFGSVTKNGTSTLDTNLPPPASTLSHSIKAALAYKTNDSILSAYGRVTGLNTSTSIPSIIALRILGQARFQPQPSGIVKVVAYYPKRLSSDELQVITLL